MAAPVSVLTRWNKTPVVVDTQTTIAGRATTRTHTFRNVGMGAMPMAFPSLDFQGLYAQSAMQDAGAATLGIERGEFPLEFPLTTNTAAFVYTALMHKKTYSATGAGSIANTLPTKPFAGNFAAMQFGNDQTAPDAVNGVFEAYGCVCKKAALSIAAWGTDGGKVSLSTDWLFAAIARADAAIGAAGVVDSLAPYQGKEAVITVAAITSNILACNLVIETDAAMDPTMTLVPAFCALGEYKVSGDVTVVYDPSAAASSAWETIYTNQKVKTATTFQIVFTRSTHTFTIALTSGVLFGPGGAISEQGGIAVQTFPFTGVVAPVITTVGVGGSDPCVDWS